MSFICHISHVSDYTVTRHFKIVLAKFLHFTYSSNTFSKDYDSAPKSEVSSGYRRKEVTEGWQKLYKEWPHNQCPSSNIIIMTICDMTEQFNKRHGPFLVSGTVNILLHYQKVAIVRQHGPKTSDITRNNRKIY
jgi:hypothetical protein